MSKIKILEVNNFDLVGNRFNGYDMINDLSDETMQIKQAVIDKMSDNENVIEILPTESLKIYNDNLTWLEMGISVKNIFSITSPCLMNLKEYKEADIIHIHMFHNTKLSLYSLRKIASEKKLIVSLHDPWFVTGRCVHFFDCDKWKTGCKKCPNLNTLFEFKEDKCSQMWEIKKSSFEDLDIDLFVATDWMKNVAKESPIIGNIKHVHQIPFGLDSNKFRTVSNKEARKHYNIPKDNVVLFLRAQHDFKGTQYVLEALKKLNTNIPITVLTCEKVGLLDEVKDKYNIIDLGIIKDQEMVYAMNACDIFLMPSLGESFGMMAIEAMSCEKPVIIFNNTALPSVTYAPECGYLVKDRDADDLMKAIKNLVENPEERTRRGKLGFEIVQKEYTNEIYNERMKKMYIDVYNRPRKKQIIKTKKKETNEKNVEQFKYFLNYLTVRFFGTNNDISKKLLYKLKPSKFDPKYIIDYTDINVQELLYQYMQEVSKYLNEHKDYKVVESKVRIQKLLYLVMKNPKFLIKMIIDKIKK